MYEAHPDFNTPDDPNTKIWRYMDIVKFEKLIGFKKMYCRRTDAFYGDPFEGRLPNRIAERMDQTWESAVASQPTTALQNLARESANASREFHQSWRRRIAVNCWHMNSKESAAMWSIYSNRGKGVAIQSTVKRLCSSLDISEHPAYVGVIEYLDYDTTEFPLHNFLQQIVRKRESFKFESELRVVVRNQDFHEFEEEGVEIDIDLNMLIESVRLSPISSDSDQSRVQKLMDDSGISVIAEHSGERPMW